MFKSATLKLTGWYLALIMGLSLAFSFVLYHSSTESLASSFDHQRTVLGQQYQQYYGVKLSPFDLDTLRSREVARAEQQLLANLILANVAVLAVGGAASFYMARRTLEPLEQAMEAQTRFTADASHELRTPLTAMQAEIEVSLRDKKMTIAEARELLESNLEEVSKLQELSNNLLMLANQETDSFTPRPVTTDAFLKDAIAHTAKAAAERTITIDNQAKTQRVLGTKDGLAQLSTILLDNAIKYSPVGATITITAATKGGNALISFVDQGQGIKAEDLPRIFDRLFRADQSRNKEKVRGFGLGLSIAKKIAELHKGAIDVTSQVGKGSTFTIRIPLAPKATEPKNAPQK